MANAREYNALRKGSWVGELGIEILTVEDGRLVGEIEVRPQLLSPNGFLHAATIVGLADSLCGAGAMEHLPDGAQGYTTIELKTNLIGTAREGIIQCEALLRHRGRSTHVWDATVSDKRSGRTIALFRCTQLMLYPHSPGRTGPS